MQYTNLTWRNGQPYSELFDDIYYSSDEDANIPGSDEFKHVFFQHNRLSERWIESRNTGGKAGRNFVIAELGLGSGLNCILTIKEWLKYSEESGDERTLFYIAIEKYPLSPATISGLLSQYSELKPYCDELLENYPPAISATHVRQLFGNRVVIHFKFMDVFDALSDEQLDVDAWYLDGFSPANNPQMWSESLFQKIAQNSHQGSTCSTYTAAGFVRRNLQAAGFTVNKVKGFGHKREMLIAELVEVKQPDYRFADKPWFIPPRYQCSEKSSGESKATVIGAGISGLSVAWSLAKRGWKVTLIDQHHDVAQEASANPAAIVYPRLAINNDTDTEFYIAAYFYCLYILKKLQKNHQQKFWFDDGLLQSIETKRIAQIIEKYEFNSDYISLAEALPDELKKESDTLLSYVNFKTAGVVLPELLCKALQLEYAEAIKFHQNRVSRVSYENSRWCCYSGAEKINETEVLVLANGTGVNNPGLPQEYPVEVIRGQAIILNSNKASENINKTINAEKYITQRINTKHYLGGTYSRTSTSSEIDEKDNVELLTSLNKIYPDIFNKDDIDDAWTGFRVTSKDRVPIAGAVTDINYFEQAYADISQGNAVKSYPPARYLDGLYVFAAPGSRAFTSCFLCAEVIASQITGEPAPVSRRVLDYLSPSRFIVSDLKRR